MIPSSSYTNNENKALIRLNRKLGPACVPYLIDETCIANLYSELASLYAPSRAYYWLLYARFTEAALLCAGNYADNCEYSAAGDLLVNPRRIEVYDKVSGNIKVKKRHKSISEQFKPKDTCAEEFRKGFSSKTILQIAEPALLPLLSSTLIRSGLFNQRYLASINARMKRIADTIAFLSSWSIDNQFQLQSQLASANPQSKKFIESNLCRFGRNGFDASFHAPLE